MTTVEYPPPEFWAVVGDICEQAAREQANYPYDKTVKVELTKSEVHELRVAYVRDGGNP